jgi:2-polyprenyl-6-methoxyphenol hydroxylase-like FAD-dependent oxidoreductase
VGDRQTIVIAGAGIGGLTAALSLAQRGFKVLVVERTAELSELGAGIQIAPNAGRVLAGLGLDAAIAEAASEPVAIDVHDALRGSLIVSIPTKRFRDRYGFPYRVIHRADLQKILLAAVTANSSITLRLGATVGDFVAQASGYLVRVSRNGGQDVVPAAAVIGADGLWSTLRDRIPGAAVAEATGRTAWRGLIPADSAPATLALDRLALWLGPDAHLVHYPVARGAAVSAVAIVEEDWTRRGWSGAGDPRWLAKRFASWPEPARAVIAAPISWRKWALTTLDPSKPWVNGPVALLGDAAHAMEPFIAQGAAMAIEDAAVLAEALAEARDASAALKSYALQRKPRVAAVVRRSARVGTVYHWRPPLAAVRNAVLRFAGPFLILAANDWIYRWKAETARERVS